MAIKIVYYDLIEEHIKIFSKLSDTASDVVNGGNLIVETTKWGKRS